MKCEDVVKTPILGLLAVLVIRDRCRAALACSSERLLNIGMMSGCTQSTRDMLAGSQRKQRESEDVIAHTVCGGIGSGQACYGKVEMT